MLTVNLDGEFFTYTKHPEFLIEIAESAEIDVSRLTIPADELATYQADELRQKVRREVEPLAGDTQSIQGTIADNVGLLMEKLGRLALAHAHGDAAFAAAMVDIANTLAPLVTAIDTGSCTMTHHVKGVGTVVSDACQR